MAVLGDYIKVKHGYAFKGEFLAQMITVSYL